MVFLFNSCFEQCVLQSCICYIIIKYRLLRIKLIRLIHVYYIIMKLIASRTDRENMLFLIGMIVIIIGILALLLAYVFFPIQTANINIGQTVISEISIWKYI